MRAKVTVCEVDMAGRAVTGGDPVPPVRGGVVPRPGLFGRLGAAGRVTEVSAPAGSGKTLLLRSWISEAGLGDTAAWVSVQPEERDAAAVLVVGPGRAAGHGGRVGAGAGADGGARPGYRGRSSSGCCRTWRSLQDRLWLVIDDVHELRSAEALRQLELLMMRAPAAAAVRAGHPAVICGSGCTGCGWRASLTEIRAADLRFTPGRGAGAVRGGRGGAARSGAGAAV